MRQQQGRLAGALRELSTSGSHLLSPLGFPFLRQQQTILRIIKPTSLRHRMFSNQQNRQTSRAKNAEASQRLASISFYVSLVPNILKNIVQGVIFSIPILSHGMLFFSKYQHLLKKELHNLTQWLNAQKAKLSNIRSNFKRIGVSFLKK